MVGVALPHSAPVQGVSRPPHTASRDCRTAHPLPVRSRVRLHRKAGSRRKENGRQPQERVAQKLAKRCSRGAKGTLYFLSAHPHAAQRAVTGWRGGLGRVGADLASAGSMRPPPSPARHVSSAWLATTKASRETTRHANTARLATICVSRETPARPASRHHTSPPTRQAPKHLPGQNEN